MCKSKVAVAIVFGGRSSEHEVSVESAASIFKAIDRRRYVVWTMGITKQGAFIMNVDPVQLTKGRCQVTDQAPRLKGEEWHDATHWLAFLESVDIVFPALHGPYGEDGSFQGFLDILQIPYVGSSVLGSALSMDKATAKDLFSFQRLPVVPYYYFTRYQWQQHRQMWIDRALELTFPVFVKPANLGSSVGIHKVKSVDAYVLAVEDALMYDLKIIVEKAVNARELECSVLGNNEPLVSVVGEIVPSGCFYDYESKYLSNASQLFIPAEIKPQMARTVHDLALKAYGVTQCQGLARVDFLLDREDEDKIYLSEVNTMPGFTRISMYPKMWEASGLAFTELITKLVSLALEKNQERETLLY